MTDAEKKMKKYTNALERRLELPSDIKNRVMSDFISAITARRESGMTDDEIYRELGTPKQAAATLNEQMKEYTYRKSPWRFVFLAAAVYGTMELLSGIWVNLVYLWYRFQAGDQVMGIGMTRLESSSIGIIGGADGPTTIFVTTPVWANYLWGLLLVLIGIWGFWRLCRCKRK